MYFILIALLGEKDIKSRQSTKREQTIYCVGDNSNNFEQGEIQDYMVQNTSVV